MRYARAVLFCVSLAAAGFSTWKGWSILITYLFAAVAVLIWVLLTPRGGDPPDSAQESERR